jgi:hypothetical protein
MLAVHTLGVARALDAPAGGSAHPAFAGDARGRRAHTNTTRIAERRLGGARRAIAARAQALARRWLAQLSVAAVGGHSALDAPTRSDVASAESICRALLVARALRARRRDVG